MDYQEGKESDWHNTIGGKIRRTRKTLNLTQEKLAERAGLHYSYIGQVERGDKKPSLSSLHKIANALNVGVDFLLEEEIPYEIDETEMIKKELWKLVRNRSKEDLQMLVDIAKSVFNRLDSKKG